MKRMGDEGCIHIDPLLSVGIDSLLWVCVLLLCVCIAWFTNSTIYYVLVWQWLMTMTNGCYCWSFPMLVWWLTPLLAVLCISITLWYWCWCFDVNCMLWYCFSVFPAVFGTCSLSIHAAIKPCKGNFGCIMSNSINSCKYSSAGHKQLTAYQFIAMTLSNFSLH
jgi:hypothetical protein